MIKEHHIEVRRSARFLTLGELNLDVNDVWIVCHGYGQLASDFIREFEVIEAPQRLIVAPEALNRYYISTAPGFHGAESRVGATWMTREDREAEIKDYVEYLDDLYASLFAQLDRAKCRVTVVGFSQGGATATRWLMHGDARADRLILWGSLLPSDADLSQAAMLSSRVALAVVYGKRDQYADPAIIAEQEKIMKANGVHYGMIVFDGGHRMDRDTLRLLAESVSPSVS
jgi:predicted esterase